MDIYVKSLCIEDLSINIGDENRSRTSSANRRLDQNGILSLFIWKSIEKSQMLREAEQEYKDLLRQLEEDENVTREDLENFKKNALVHKSILEVRRRAQAL